LIRFLNRLQNLIMLESKLRSLVDRILLLVRWRRKSHSIVLFMLFCLRLRKNETGSYACPLRQWEVTGGYSRHHSRGAAIFISVVSDVICFAAARILVSSQHSRVLAAARILVSSQHRLDSAFPNHHDKPVDDPCFRVSTGNHHDKPVEDPDLICFEMLLRSTLKVFSCWGSRLPRCY